MPSPRSPTLSVCCLCDSGGARAAAALAPLRAVADEVVVAVDERLAPAELAALAGVADRLHRIAPIGWAAQAWSWLHRQCSGDWIFRLDGDEACSPALLAALPGLLERRDVRQYAVHRRWLWPDGGSWLPEHPWGTDRQRRLYRNDASLHFSGRPGSGAEPSFPARDVREPLLGLGAILHPERHAPPPHARRQDLGDAERAAARAVLEASAAHGGIAAPPPVVPAETVRRRWAGRELGEDAYRARVVPLSGPRVLRVAEQRPFHVAIHNEGDEPWPGGDEREPLIRPSYHWLDASGATVVFDGLRTGLPAPLAAGRSCRMPVSVLAPPQPGEYELRFDLVHEGHRWFGSPAVPVPVTVRAA
jgi:hypothetical protein